jgi:aspartate/methionine/tyrosine aminotransferase
MNLEVFELERYQSEWENRVSFNLSESGVHAISVEELLEPAAREQLLREPLAYVQTNGTIALRETIARMYAGARADNLVVANGTAEANYIAIWRLVEPGDEVVLMVPNYMQICGIVRAQGGVVVPWRLREEYAWAPDLTELMTLVSSRTRIIAVCNPNNPTGSILTEEAMQAIVTLAAKRGIWVLADEVYRGSERDGRETPSFWGRYDRSLVTCGLSKAYGLPGLRVGWVLGPAPIISELWARKDYLSIAPGALSDILARRALQPAVRARILKRTREIINASYGVFETWIGDHGTAFHLVAPRAGAIAYPRYSWPISSTRLVERLRHEESVLVVPGDQFGMDGYLRVGLGNDPGQLRAALEHVDRVLASLGPAA